MNKPRRRYLSCILTAAFCISPFAWRLSAQTATPAPTPNYVAQLRGATDPNTAAATYIVNTVPQAVSINFQTVARVANLLWRNPTQAQAIVDKMAEKAAPVFIMYGEMAGPLSVIDPASYAKLPKPPAGYGWTILPAQADGTWPAGQRSVVITYTPPATPTPSPTPAPSATPTPAS